MGYKGRNALRERALLQEDVIEVAEGMSVLPEDSREYSRPIQALSSENQQMLLPRTLLSALQRFSHSKHRLYWYRSRYW